MIQGTIKGSMLKSLGGKKGHAYHRGKLRTVDDDLVIREETETTQNHGVHAEAFFSSVTSANTYLNSSGTKTNSGSTFGSTDYGSRFNSGGHKFRSFEKGITFNSNSSTESVGRLTSGSSKDPFDSSDPTLASAGRAALAEPPTPEIAKPTPTNDLESEFSGSSPPVDAPPLLSPLPAQAPESPVEVPEPQAAKFDGSELIRKVDAPLKNCVDVHIPLDEFCSLQEQTDVTLESAERNLEILEKVVDAICERLQKLGDDVGDTNNQVTAIEMVNHVQTETGRMIGYGSDMEKAGLDQMRNFFAQGVLSFSTVFMPILMFLWNWISKLIPDKQKKNHGARRSLTKN